jgi:glycosyltransferase involved in cell wall biosynthesis
VRTDLRRPVRLLIRLVETLALVNTDALYAVSDKEADLLRRPQRALGVRVVAGFNVAPRTAMRTAIETGREASTSKLCIMGVGRIGAAKNPREFAEVAKRLERAAPNRYSFLWIGSGDADLEAILRGAGVEITGWLSEGHVDDLLHAAHAYVHTAAWEAFPVSVMKAVAANVPVLIRTFPMLPSLLEPLAYDSVDQVVEGILALQDPEAVGRALEKSGLIRDRVSEERLARILADLYVMD